MLPILREAAMIVGGDEPNVTMLANLINAPRPAIYVWERVPSAYVLAIERATKGKIKRWQLREDLYPRSDYKRREKKK